MSWHLTIGICIFLGNKVVFPSCDPSKVVSPMLNFLCAQRAFNIFWIPFQKIKHRGKLVHLDFCFCIPDSSRKLPLYGLEIICPHRLKLCHKYLHPFAILANMLWHSLQNYSTENHSFHYLPEFIYLIYFLYPVDLLTYSYFKIHRGTQFTILKLVLG